LAFGYEIPGQFGHKTGSNAGKGFNASSKRMPTPRKNTSDELNSPNAFDRNANNFG
jgi:hypothetical protein